MEKYDFTTVHYCSMHTFFQEKKLVTMPGGGFEIIILYNITCINNF